MEIRWLVSASASGCYAAGEMLRGHTLVDSPLSAALAKPVEELRRAIVIWCPEPTEFVDHMTALAIEPTAIADQVRIAIRKVAGELSVDRYAKELTAVMDAIQRQFVGVHNNAIEELELRSAPLREQWEARGPGLLAMIGRLLGASVLAESADVVLVQPVTGGGGRAHGTYNRVSFEAVLANPVRELPEIVRLGWLLGQLQLDLPGTQGNLSRQRTLEVGRLALIPAALAAGHEVEMCGPVEDVLGPACLAWRAGKVDQAALLAWWETYVADRPPWSAALAALDQMLSAEPCAPTEESE